MKNNPTPGNGPGLPEGRALQEDVQKAWEMSIHLQGLTHAAELVAFYKDGTSRQQGALIAVLEALAQVAEELNEQLEGIQEIAKRAELLENSISA